MKKQQNVCRVGPRAIRIVRIIAVRMKVVMYFMASKFGSCSKKRNMFIPAFSRHNGSMGHLMGAKYWPAQ